MESDLINNLSRVLMMAIRFSRPDIGRVAIGVIPAAMVVAAVTAFILQETSSSREQRFARKIRAFGGQAEIQNLWPASLPNGTFLDRYQFVDRLTELWTFRMDWSDKSIPTDLLAEIRLCDRLECLALDDCPQVTDSDLKNLQALNHLHLLWLNNTNVTDAGLVHLGAMQGLNDLRLEGSKITDVGLEQIHGLNNLAFLNIGNTAVTDAGLQQLCELKSLHTLFLDGTSVTNEGLKHLKGMARLQALRLANTQIDDVGIDHLKGMTSLRGLCLINTPTTEEGRATLRRALPNCKIEPNP